MGVQASRGAKCPGRGAGTPLSLLGRVDLGVGWVCWVTHGFIALYFHPGQAARSANVLKCAFCLSAPLVLAENSEPRRAVLSPMTSAGKGLQPQGSVEPGLPPAWTRSQRPHPVRPGPEGSVGSTPFWGAVRTVRPRGRHEFSFSSFPQIKVPLSRPALECCVSYLRVSFFLFPG